MEDSDIGDAPEEVAIVGMTGRFPGAPNLTTYWENLRNGVDSITRFTEWAGALSENPAYVPARGVLEDAFGFDAAFFGVNPNEALVTDPQHRVFLECAWTALETAGYTPQGFNGSIGVYAGMTNNTYFSGAVAHHPELIEAVGAMQTMLGNEKDFLTTRVAYKLDLKGPALSINTACSTSLVAVCQAASSLLSYQCDMALAGGISLT
ncbi:MAG: polyketide synthase, partial [Alphaproteobacteria bacterium]